MITILTTWFGFFLCLFSPAAAMATAGAQELTIMPTQEVITMAEGESIVFTCSVSNARNQNTDLKWYGIDNKQLLSETGR